MGGTTGYGMESGEGHMRWSPHEAAALEVRQQGPSDCGCTSLANVFLSLNIDVPSEQLRQAATIRARAYDAPVPQYLASRSVAGATAHDLIKDVEKITAGSVRGRLFEMSPARALPPGELFRWLEWWLRLDVAAVATMNYQVIHPSADAWHHQLIYGVQGTATRSGENLQLAWMLNPHQPIPMTALCSVIASHRVLRVRARDIASRVENTAASGDEERFETIMREMEHMSTPAPVPAAEEWRRLRVKQQVSEVVRASIGFEDALSCPLYIYIPAAYRSGITLFARNGSEAWREIEGALEFGADKCIADSSDQEPVVEGKASERANE